MSRGTKGVRYFFGRDQHKSILAKGLSASIDGKEVIRATGKNLNENVP
jgi:hypothetical protein